MRKQRIDRGGRMPAVKAEQENNEFGRPEGSGEHKPYSLSWLLDSSIRLPGGFRIGLDGIIGLIPGVGDAIGGGLSSWIFYQAYKRGVPKFILMRMLINIVIDTALGAIPVVGDLFDLMFKANLKNAELLERYHQYPQPTHRRSAITTILFFAGLFLIGFLLIYFVLSLLTLAWQRIT